jgi:hypothetical protein
MLRWHDCAVFKVRFEAHVHELRKWTFGLSKLNSMRPYEQAHRAPGPVDIRYRVELEVDGMPTWPSPALQVLELP